MRHPELAFSPSFSWQNRNKIMYAPGLRKEIGTEMSLLGGKRVAVFTDRGLVQAGVADLMLQAVKQSGLELAGVFDQILQDAQIDIINRGAAFYRESGADSMIALGGGSVMDSAKAINILIGAGEKDFAPLAAKVLLMEGARPLPPHIAFPTTAGTACEVSYGMVVLDTANHTKMAVAHPFCQCDVAMLDPELTVKLPAKITAFTGIDAMTHAIESFVSLGAEPIADALDLHAIRLAYQYLPLAVKEPENILARGNMLIASTMAGMGFVNTMTGAVHALAHSLGGRYGIPHGIANSILLPEVMAFNLPDRLDRFVVIADALGLAVNGIQPVEAGKAAIQAIRDLKKEIGLTQTLMDYGVPAEREALQPVIALALADMQGFANPRKLDEDSIYSLCLKAM